MTRAVRSTTATRRRLAALAGAGVALAGTLATVGTTSGAQAAGKGPDQVVTSVGSVPDKVRMDTRFSMGARVTNKGGASAGASQVSFHFSKDKTRGGDDVLGGTTATKRQVPGKVSTVAASLRAPMEGGKYWVIVCADAPGRVRETNERNNCKVSATQVEVDDALHALLTGDLTFTDQGMKAEGNRLENWQRTASADIKMVFDGQILAGKFASEGSTYNRLGSRDISVEDPDCRQVTDFDEAGEGTFAYTGDATKDDIYGWFTDSDMSSIRIGLFMRADWAQVRTQSGRGEFPCEAYQTTSDGTNLVTISVELEEVDSTSHSIEYEVTEWKDAYGTPSDFEAATGRLTLTLR